MEPCAASGERIADAARGRKRRWAVGCDQTLSERKGRNHAGRCVIERRCAAMTQSARFFCRAKSSGLKMAACGIAANGGVRCHSRYFPCDLCVPLHGQALVTPCWPFRSQQMVATQSSLKRGRTARNAVIMNTPLRRPASGRARQGRAVQARREASCA